MLTVSIASSIVSGVMQYQAQQEQAKAADARYAQNIKNANEAFLNDVRQNNLRTDQEQQAAAQKKLQNKIELAKAEGEMTARVAEKKISGNSVLNIFADTERAALNSTNAVQRNLDMTTGQLAMNVEGFKADYNQRVNSMSPGAHPSLLAAGAGIAGNVADTWNKAPESAKQNFKGYFA